jgi:O-antigen/teichoic acid export membrane protein
MLNKFNFIKNGDFKNFSVLTFGVILANIIPIALQPTLKSLYSPELFGYFEIYFRFSSLLVIFFSMRYDYLVFSAKTPEQLSRHLFFVFSLITINFFLSLLILFFISNYLLLKLNIPNNFNFLIWVIPISSFFIACFHLLIFYRTKLSQFVIISYSRFYRRLSEGFVQVAMGLYGFSAFGLFAGEIFGNIVAIWKLNKTKLFLKRKRSYKFYLNYYKKLFLKNIKYPINKALPDFLSLFAESILVILILREFGIIYVGYLELSFKILVIPVTIVGAAIAPLILQKASAAINNNFAILVELRGIFILLLFISSIFFFFVIFALEPIFYFLFDDIWYQSFTFISILVYLVCIQLVISPMGELLILINKLQVDASWKYLKIITLSSLLFYQYDDVNSLLIIYTTTSFLLYLLYFFLIFYYVRSHDLSTREY